MSIESDSRVEMFITDTLSIDVEKGEMLVALRKMILEISPNASQKIMYGGIVFNVDSELVTGIFTYKKHISIEFSQGIKMSDPDGLLEGNGKCRRHLKLMTLHDLSAKNTAYYVKQAFE